jgi:hypothetical protein
MIPQPVQHSESVLMDMFFPVVSTGNYDNEITIIEENILTTPTIDISNYSHLLFTDYM